MPRLFWRSSVIEQKLARWLRSFSKGSQMRGRSRLDHTTASTWLSTLSNSRTIAMDARLRERQRPLRRTTTTTRRRKRNPNRLALVVGPCVTTRGGKRGRRYSFNARDPLRASCFSEIVVVILPCCLATLGSCWSHQSKIRRPLQASSVLDFLVQSAYHHSPVTSTNHQSTPRQPAR